jgi:tripeptide aminopeptidase
VLALGFEDVLRCSMPSRSFARSRPVTPLEARLGAACQRISNNNEQTLTWQRNLTRIAAPTGNEAARAQWMADAFESVGWSDVAIDAVGNVIARHPRARPDDDTRGSVWCCAHLDTVFADPSPVVEQRGTRLMGPGISDNGRGLAALLALADALHLTPMELPSELGLIATVGEEGLGDLRGMRALLREAEIPPSAVIAVDGTGDSRIVRQAVGSQRYRVTFTGPGGHSWADAGAPNPIQAVALVAGALRGVLLPREPRTAVTVTRIGGGESINSIPQTSWLDVDIRSLEDAVLDRLVATLHETAARVVRAENQRADAEDDVLTMRIDPLGTRPCGELAATHPLVRAAEEVTRGCGIQPHFAVGSTDASAALALGIPAIAIGAGGLGGGMHTPDEWYEDVDGVRGLQRALRLAVRAAHI